MAALDDATGGILAARFFVFEGTEGYLWLLRQTVTLYGIPISIYQDRHGSLKRNCAHYLFIGPKWGANWVTLFG